MLFWTPMTCIVWAKVSDTIKTRLYILCNTLMDWLCSYSLLPSSVLPGWNWKTWTKGETYCPLLTNKWICLKNKEWKIQHIHNVSWREFKASATLTDIIHRSHDSTWSSVCISTECLNIRGHLWSSSLCSIHNGTSPWLLSHNHIVVLCGFLEGIWDQCQ